MKSYKHIPTGLLAKEGKDHYFLSDGSFLLPTDVGV